MVGSLGPLRTPGRPCIPDLPSTLLGVRPREALVGQRIDATELAQDIQSFVITHQYDHRATRHGRLLLEPHEKVEGGADVLSVIDQVARLDEDGVAADPMVFSVDQIQVLQECGDGVGCPLNLTEDDDFAVRGLSPMEVDRRRSPASFLRHAG